jgi:hypothetical protein
MFVNSMATRRTKRVRRGSGKFSQFVRRHTGYQYGPSTSLLAREIKGMLGPHDIKEGRVEDFNNLMRVNHDYNKRALFEELDNLGVDKVYQLHIRNRLKYL